MSTQPEIPSPGDERRKPENWQVSLREAGPYLGLGMQLALVMAVFSVGGLLLDRWLGTLPWLTVVGGVVGMIAVFVQIVRVAGDLSRPRKPPGESGPPGH